MIKEKKLDRRNPIPLSQQLYEILRDLIIKGNYKPGTPFFTENEISEKYGVSRTTVREATNQLVYEGFLQRERGKGTVIVRSNIHVSSGELIPFSEQIRNRGMEPSSLFIEMVVLEPTWLIKNILQINKNDKVIKFTRVRLADKEPLAIHISYLPYSSCSSLLTNKYEWGKESLTAVLDKLGLKMVRANQRVYATVANEYQANLLKIHRGDPLLCLEQICFLENNVPIEYVEIFNRGDRWDIISDLKRK